MSRADDFMVWVVAQGRVADLDAAIPEGARVFRIGRHFYGPVLDAEVPAEFRGLLAGPWARLVWKKGRVG